MTTEIPPRPSAPLGMAWAAHYAHQEAVARVAVEALRDMDGFFRSGNEVPVERATILAKHQYVQRMKRALAKIEASKWQP